MRKYDKIAYLTVIPFKDTGNVVEYFIKNSNEFYLYLFPPSYKNQPTEFLIYKNGKLFEKDKFWFYKGNNKLLIHIFYYLYFLLCLFKYRVRDTFIIFYFPLYLFLNAQISLVTRNKYIFWIWDYFPTKSKVMDTYNKLVLHYNNHLQYVMYLSPNLKKIYSNRSRSSSVREVVSFGIKDRKIVKKVKHNVLGYIGNLRPGQGIEFLIDVAKQNNKITVEFIGDGPLRAELEHIVAKNKLTKRVLFHGFVNNDELLGIVSRWQIAVAPYIPSKDNPTIYTEPGKIKLYIELGLPVIMTKVSYIYKDLLKYNAGLAIDYKYASLIDAITIIQKSYSKYRAGVALYKKDNLFETYYNKKFKFLERNEKKS